MTDDVTWAAPGDGDWWLVREHFPHQISPLFASLFPPVTAGWKVGGARYGLSTGVPRWGYVNGWIYYGPPISLDADELAERDIAAAAVLAGATPWRDEVRRWHDSERPAAVAANRSLQAVDVVALDDALLSAHLQRTIENFRRWASLHFEHTGFDLAAGLLLQAGAGWGIPGPELIGLLAGASPASAAVDRRLAAVAAALDDAGAPRPIGSFAAVRAAGPEARATLDAFLDEYGLRPVSGHDLRDPTLGERPELVLASLEARRGPARGGGSASAVEAATAEVRSRVAEPDRARFDELLDDARSAYGLRDDDVGVCWNWPLGLIRHAALEVGRRLAAEGVVERPDDVFEVVVDELPGLLAGRGPSPVELAARRAGRERAVDPPAHLAGGGAPAPEPPRPANVEALEAIRQPLWSVAPAAADGPLHGIGIGTGAAVGPARFVLEPEDVMAVEEGDVLVAVATTTAYNSVFPLLAAVVTEQGGLLSHTAILARELGLPAVVGVDDLFEHVAPGDVVEVDPVRSSVRVVDRPR